MSLAMQAGLGTILSDNFTTRPNPDSTQSALEFLTANYPDFQKEFPEERLDIPEEIIAQVAAHYDRYSIQASGILNQIIQDGGSLDGIDTFMTPEAETFFKEDHLLESLPEEYRTLVRGNLDQLSYLLNTTSDLVRSSSPALNLDIYTLIYYGRALTQRHPAEVIMYKTTGSSSQSKPQLFSSLTKFNADIRAWVSTDPFLHETYSLFLVKYLSVLKTFIHSLATYIYAAEVHSQYTSVSLQGRLMAHWLLSTPPATTPPLELGDTLMSLALLVEKLREKEGLSSPLESIKTNLADETLVSRVIFNRYYDIFLSKHGGGLSALAGTRHVVSRLATSMDILSRCYLFYFMDYLGVVAGSTRVLLARESYAGINAVSAKSPEDTRKIIDSFSKPQLVEDLGLRFGRASSYSTFSPSAKLTCRKAKRLTPLEDLPTSLQGLPGQIWLVEITDRKKVILPVLQGMDEATCPVLLIPSSPQVLSFFLKTYGAHHYLDPLSIYGPLAHPFTKMDTSLGQSAFAERVSISNMSAERLELQGVTDIRPYFGQSTDKPPTAHDMFSKYTLQPHVFTEEALYSLVIGPQEDQKTDLPLSEPTCDTTNSTTPRISNWSTVAYSIAGNFTPGYTGLAHTTTS